MIMVKASESASRWPFPDGEAKISALDPHEFDLIRQAIAQALDSGEDCEIEQMVRRRTVVPVRRRVQVRLGRDFSSSIAAVSVAIERDGEPIAAWTLPREAACGKAVGNAAMIEAIDAFTAIVLQAEALKRQVARSQHEELSSAIEHILTNVQRAWQRVGGLCRERLQIIP